MSNPPGVLCISVDSKAVESDSAALQRRRNDLQGLLKRFQLPSNWTISSPPQGAVGTEIEVTVSVPKRISRPELVMYLRRLNAGLSQHGLHTQSVILDPHEARSLWDVLVKQGCHVARPRTATAC